MDEGDKDTVPRQIDLWRRLYRMLHGEEPTLLEQDQFITGLLTERIRIRDAETKAKTKTEGA